MAAIEFADLEKKGVFIAETNIEKSSRIDIGGIPISLGETSGMEYRAKLPRAAAVECAFTREGLGKQFVKLFKSELQTGDHAFDDVVYITTNDKEKTAAFLKSETARRAVQDVVQGSGAVAVSGDTVTVFSTYDDAAVAAKIIDEVLRFGA